MRKIRRCPVSLDTVYCDGQCDICNASYQEDDISDPEKEESDYG